MKELFNPLITELVDTVCLRGEHESYIQVPESDFLYDDIDGIVTDILSDNIRHFI